MNMNAQDLSNSILNEMELDAVMRFKSDPLMFQATKKYILAVAYKHGVVKSGEEHNPAINFALNLAWGATNPNGVARTDEALGQNLRAMTYAVQLVEGGFKEMSEMEKPKVEEEKVINEAE